MKYDDGKFYEFHESDAPDRCFACSDKPVRPFIVRQIKSMLLVHLCRDCLLNNLSDYILDNTRPWR